MTAILEPDETWSVFGNFPSEPDLFAKEFIPDLYLKPHVPIDVRDNFEVITKLLQHSHYVCKFYDVAVLKCLLTLEMALKLRYKKIYLEDWGTRSLKSLMDLFKKNRYFEVYNSDYLDHVRTIRNTLAHPSQHSVSGPNGKIIIENVLDLINGLYECPKLRLKRIKLSSQTSLPPAVTLLHRRRIQRRLVVNDARLYFNYPKIDIVSSPTSRYRTY